MKNGLCRFLCLSLKFFDLYRKKCNSLPKKDLLSSYCFQATSLNPKLKKEKKKEKIGFWPLINI